MIETFVKRPATTIIFVSFFIVLGIVSYFNINVEETPKIDLPIITVKTIYPGATPLEVETQVLKKVEDAVAEISQIKKVRSFAYENFGYTTIEFILEADVNIKSIEVKDKVDAIIEDLPSGAEKPIIEKVDVLAKPVASLVLSGSGDVDSKALYEFADKKLRNMITAIDGVATIKIFGGKERQINVLLDPMLMKKYFVSITSVIEAIKIKNMNIPGGVIDQQESAYSVRFLGEFLTLEDIKNTVIVSPEGTELTIADIGEVIDGHKKVETIARFNGEEVVSMDVINVSDGNAINIVERINQKLPEIRKMLPVGMKLEIASDVAEFLIGETLDTQINILIGILLTVVILFMFTGNIRVTFIASIIIPSSIVSTFFLMDSAKFTINMMTLLAIASALGTLIANAIVIIENVILHVEKKGKDPQTAAIEGTKEVTVAVLASAGTNLVVFTPIAFMGGVVGQFMTQFGFTVVFATIFSLIASFSLTPMLCGLLIKPRKNKDEKRSNPVLALTHKVMAFLLSEYKVIFNAIFRFPKTTLLLVFATLVGAGMLMPYVGNEFVPKYDQDKIGINLVLPQGVTIERTHEVVKVVEGLVKDIPEVKSYLSTIGENGVENAGIAIDLTPGDERDRTDVEIIESIIPKLAPLPDVEIEITRGPGGGKDEGDVSINVYGQNYNQIIKNSSEMVKVMQDSGYFSSVTSSYKLPKNELRFKPDQKKMVRYGVPNALIAQTLRASIYGDESNIFKEGGEEYEIKVALNENYMSKEADINQINIISRKGLLPITALGDVEKGKAMPSIRRQDKERVVVLTGTLAKSTSGVVSRILDKSFTKIDFGENHGYYYAGDADMQAESERELGKAFLLATILTYMILAAILNSFVHPITIITSVITSIVGVALILFFLEFSINIGALLAVVMLVGLVVNNAILLLDHTLRKLKEGDSIIDAIWAGASDKFQIIVMTSLAIVLGALPQIGAVNLAKASIGAVIVGGMLASIIYTFVLIPVVFWYLERLKRFLGFK